MAKVGRPTKYRPEMIVQIHKYLEKAIPENMKIPTIEGVALELGVSRRRVYDWKEKYPEFRHTLDEVLTRQKEILQEIGIFGGKEINATIVQLLLKVNHGMVETTRTEHTGADGEPLKFEWKDANSKN